jgi:ABC-type transporter Mla subunit MlaD
MTAEVGTQGPTCDVAEISLDDGRRMLDEAARAAHGALALGRKKLQAATRGVDELVNDVASGRSALCRTPADALKRRRDLIVEYNKLTRSLNTAAAALSQAKAALDQLDGKPSTPRPRDAGSRPSGSGGRVVGCGRRRPTTVVV